MSSITAAVVGVVLNLAAWFTLNTIFGSLRDVYVLGAHLQVPDIATTNVPSLIIAIVAMLALFRFKISMIYTIAGCAMLGVAYHLMRVLVV
jgi:chromate transporter